LSNGSLDGLYSKPMEREKLNSEAGQSYPQFSLLNFDHANAVKYFDGENERIMGSYKAQIFIQRIP